jgi:hypothetical protein
MNGANLQCEIKGCPAGGSSAHHFGRHSSYKRRDHGDRVGAQYDRRFQKRNRPVTERIGSGRPLRHRSYLYAERRQDISARTTAGAVTLDAATLSAHSMSRSCRVE